MESLIDRTLILGSRPSKLALWQTEHVKSRLEAAWPGLSCEIVTMVTQGDRNLAQPLPEIGGKGVFTEELEAALLGGQIDLAVHSLKDLPVDLSSGLCIGAISQRADARDAFISKSGMCLIDLPVGARVGTSSLRRQAQLLALRPDLVILPLRGNVDTRLRKALNGEFDGIILAAAGLERLGLDNQVTQALPFEMMLPAPGQGALAIQCRSIDHRALALLEPLHDKITAGAVTAERSFLANLGGGCSAPVAALATTDLNSNPDYYIQGLVAQPDGKKVIRVTAGGIEPNALGAKLAQAALDQGAGEILSL